MNKINTKTSIFSVNLLKSVAFSMALVLSIQVKAQDSLKTKELNEVIISATRVEENTQDVGRSVTVISSEEIQNSTYSNVAEILSKEAGIYIVGTGQTPGSIQTMYLRGADAGHTVIMIDGVRITDPSSPDNSVNLTEISLANINQIEIVRGAHSTLYGTSAIGGVINIITNRGAKKGLSGIAGVTVGNFGKSTLELTENAQINYGLSNGLYFRGEVLNSRIQGIDATVDTVTRASVYNVRDQDNFSNLNLIGTVGFKNKKWDISGTYKWVDQTSDIDDGAYKDDENYYVDFNRNLISWQAAYQVSEDLNLKYSGGFSNMKRMAVDDSSIVDFSNVYDRAYFEASYSGAILNNEIQATFAKEGYSIIAGLGQYGEKMTSQSYYLNTAWPPAYESNLDALNIHSNTINAYAQANLNGALLSEGLKKVNLAIGTRYNHHSTFGNHLTYSVNPSVALSKNSLIYGSVSTGFNAPALYRLYSPDEHYISGVTLGNKDLRPESSVAMEIGIKHKLSDQFSLNLSIYRTQVSDLIEFVYLWNKNIALQDLSFMDNMGYTYINLGKQSNQGIEFGFNTRLSETITLQGNMSMNSGELSYLPGSTTFENDYYVQLFSGGQFLIEEIKINGLVRRSNTANLIISYIPKKKIGISADVRYVDKRTDIFSDDTLGPYGALGQKPVNNYTLTGLTMRYEIIENLNANLRVDNIFNVKYQEINGYATRGRGVYLKLAYRF
ncbi:MAG: TonB-dependent receptor [Cyclobacteriaceae bacterium]|nr:TonB-dependent receptor [Cyclobacteriaceae bacterium]